MPDLQTRPEHMILALLQSAESFTMEEVIRGVPELSWSELFQTVDTLSRGGLIILRRRGFDYVLAAPGSVRQSLPLTASSAPRP